MSETVKTIFVGRKPLGNYLQACHVAEQKGVKDIRIVARGRPMLTAINLASILQRNGGIIRDIEIGSQKNPNFPSYVSTIEIHLELS